MYRILAVGVVVATSLAGIADAQQATTKPEKIRNALSAAFGELADNATVMDWDNTVLRQGTNEYTCLPTPPNLPGNAPMCLDAQWVKWAHAWLNKTEPQITGVGVGYMLVGDAGASNVDPFAMEATATNQWVEAGPHLMIIVPDPTVLENVSTEYGKGTPWLMWKGTPYAHLMVPVPQKPTH